jgi:hypothetical protein
LTDAHSEHLRAQMDKVTVDLSAIHPQIAGDPPSNGRGETEWRWRPPGVRENDLKALRIGRADQPKKTFRGRSGKRAVDAVGVVEAVIASASSVRLRSAASMPGSERCDTGVHQRLLSRIAPLARAPTGSTPSPNTCLEGVHRETLS